jgi:uncharacterized Tic20 family protein
MPATRACASFGFRYWGIPWSFDIRHSSLKGQIIMDEQTTPPPAPTSTPSDLRTWCVLCHASALAGLFFHFLGHILGPLIVWLMKRGDSPEIDAYGKESLNFQISMLIYDAVAAILCIVLIGVPILIALWVLNTVFVIIASVKAGQGEFYRYPFTIRLIN